MATAFLIAAMLLVSHSPQWSAKPVQITHTNIGVYTSTLDGTHLSRQERIVVARSIERFYRPEYELPYDANEWASLQNHFDHMSEKFRIFLNDGLWVEHLGYLDAWASSVKLSGFWIINRERPE